MIERWLGCVGLVWVLKLFLKSCVHSSVVFVIILLHAGLGVVAARVVQPDGVEIKSPNFKTVGPKKRCTLWQRRWRRRTAGILSLRYTFR